MSKSFRHQPTLRELNPKHEAHKLNRQALERLLEEDEDEYQSAKEDQE